MDTGVRSVDRFGGSVWLHERLTGKGWGDCLQKEGKSLSEPHRASEGHLCLDLLLVVAHADNTHYVK